MTTPPPPYGAYPPPPYGALSGALRAIRGYPQPQPTNTLAIVSLVCAFLFAPLGIVFGHISLSQIKKTGEEGRGLAVAGLVISYLITVAHHPGGRAERVVHRRRSAADLESLDGLSPGTRTSPATPSPSVRQRRCRRSSRRRRSAPTASIRPPRNRRASPSSRRAPAGCRPIPPSSTRASRPTSGDIGLQLDNGKTPCTVNNFASLAKQGFFDDTTCHRLTTSRRTRRAAVRRSDRQPARAVRATGSRTSTRRTSTG